MQAVLFFRSGIVGALLILSGCNEPPPPPAAKTFSKSEAAAKFAGIKVLHDQACRCRLAGRDATMIDRKLSALTAGLKVEEVIAPAIPVRHFGTCYPQLGKQACLSQYSLHHSFGGGDVCSVEQMDAIRNAFDSHGGDSEGAISPVKKKFAEMSAAAAKAVPQSACN